MSYNWQDRQIEKAASRKHDEKMLASGEITREQLTKKNSLFGSINIDWKNSKIINKRMRLKRLAD
jgi:hypothetical protein